jgi:hypothetical protein
MSAFPSERSSSDEWNSPKVRCYSGQTYAQRPRSFWWEGVEYEVEAIEKEWLEPGERHFQVRTKAHKLFQLCYNETQDQWSLTEPVRSKNNDK